ncbi:MAG TPA: sigma-70 family RNA polymerase sigma factor [Chitinophagaceae bacterium]
MSFSKIHSLLLFSGSHFFITNYKLLALKDQKTNDLASRLRNDDINAFNTLYWEYHAAVYANVLKLIKDPVIAEDIVQEVFVTVWGKRHTIDPKQDFAGWLFVISYHKTVDQLKRKLKDALAHKKISISIQDHSILVNSDLKEEQLTAIEKAMDQLSPQKRKVVELCKVQGRTYKKAAEELHISKYTVKEYLSEALISIRKYIGEHPQQTGIVIYFLVFKSIFF